MDDFTAHLSTPELARRLHLKAQTVRAWRGAGRGPQFLRVTPNRVCYRLQDVEAWEAERLAASTREEAARAITAGAQQGSTTAAAESAHP